MTQMQTETTGPALEHPQLRQTKSKQNIEICMSKRWAKKWTNKAQSKISLAAGWEDAR